MNDFLQFLSVVASTPRLAFALFEEALQTAWTPLLCAGITFAGFVAIWRHWQKRRRKDDRAWHETVMMPTQTGQKDDISEAKEAPVVGIDEAAFLEWYLERIDASQIILPEDQVRWLYTAYLANVEIIKAQVASEVME